MDTSTKVITCVDFWGNVTAKVELVKGIRFAHCVTGWQIVVEQLLETSCIVRLRSGNFQEIDHSQLEKWKFVEESVTPRAIADESVTGQSVTPRAIADKSVTGQSVTLSPVKFCAACGKQCSQRAKTCSPKCRKALSRKIISQPDLLSHASTKTPVLYAKTDDNGLLSEIRS